VARNPLLCHYFIPIASRGGFQVDSPVRNPVANEMPRSAPPYTDRAQEEPCKGGHVEVGPLPTLAVRSDALEQHT
jgi:hypothetical protein